MGVGKLDRFPLQMIAVLMGNIWENEVSTLTVRLLGHPIFRFKLPTAICVEVATLIVWHLAIIKVMSPSVPQV